MVKVCSLSYPSENDATYNEYHQKFKHPLHDFQKWALESIITGNHVLVCAPTGSGKSLPAEFAIDFFHSKGKKSIYCSPIKSLSNQKFYDFTKKYPHISIGLLTGDISCNTNADVLIMTTEILLNKLYQIKSNVAQVKSSTSFDMDIQNELGCVIFDEIHMINDRDRGHVWENSIIMLPKHIQMIGLSATLDNPEKFASWLENRGDDSATKEKEVYLSMKLTRPVPLTHYSFITTNTGIFKAIKDKTVHAEINALINKPFVIQSAKGEFNEEHYSKMTKMLKLFETKEIRVKRQHVLNQVSTYLAQNEMLPALFYVFSRKQLEICAHEITTSLFEFDSKVPYTIQYECEQIIRKLPNHQEYLHLPEYINLVSLLQKGVAIHHSGMMPILREIVELLFSRGMIKILFCTESVAIGLNLPVKTAVFTDVNKHDGSNFRTLHGHEYTQAAGRAGRLGLDAVGNVIHLNNLFKNIDSVSYKTMLKGKPQVLVSKFKISYNLILNLISIQNTNFSGFANKSMIKEDINSQLAQINGEIQQKQTEIEKMEEMIKYVKTPKDTIREYIDLLSKKPHAVNKKRKDIEKQIQNITDNYKFIETEKMTIHKYDEKQHEIRLLQKQYGYIEENVNNNILTILDLLEKEEFINKKLDSSLEIQLTNKGMYASRLKEMHCLVFANLVEDNSFESLTAIQLVSIFSCFTNISVCEDLKINFPKSDDKVVESLTVKIQEMYAGYMQKESSLRVDTGTDYNIHFDLLNEIGKWCTCECVEDCKYFLQNLEKEKGIFLGEFVKALLKIVNISLELESIAEQDGNISFLSKLKEIPVLIMKYVVTNQSLYV